MTALLPGREITNRQPANLTQALEGMAGVSSVSEGHAAVPAIRGLARGRTLILIDGTRVTSDRRVGPSATFLDPFVLDGIEVARGPGSVAYGSDAFGGVIYARTRRVAPGAPLGARMVGALGAGAPQQRVGVELTKGFPVGGVVFQAHYRDFDDYRSPTGDVFNSGATDQGFLARVDNQVGPGVLGVAWQSDFGRNIDRPRNNSQTVRFYYPIEDSHRFTSTYDLRRIGGFERIVVTAFGGSYRQVTDQDRYATATRGRTLEEGDYDANDFQVRGSAEKLVARARFEFGVDVIGRVNVRATDSITQYDLSGAVTSEFDSVSIESARKLDAGAFGTFEAAVAPKFTISAGLRADYVSSQNTGGYFGDHSTSDGAVSGSVSASAGPWSGFTLTGQAGSGFRDPTVSDRYYRGPTGRGFITGNPDLEPERSVQFDLGLRYTSSRIRAAFSAYNYRINNLIERYMTATDFFYFRNRGTAEIRGVEAEASAVIKDKLTLEATAMLTRGEELDEGTNLDDIPPATLTIGLRRAIGSRGFAHVRLATYASDTRPGPTEITMPAYTTLDAMGGAALGSHLDLNLTFRNLLDRNYPVSPDPRAVSAAGIQGVLTLTARF
jgi:outer membrane receptor protein involved in Fe transport